MFQPHAVSAGPDLRDASKIWIIDRETGQKALWDYHTGVEAVMRNPGRYRVASMSDDHHSQLIADAHARRPVLDAQNKAILHNRGHGPALDAKELALLGTR
jgi:hypothetical protein